MHPTVSPHIDVWDASAEIAYWCWWCLTTQTLVNIELLIGWKFSRQAGKLFQALYFKQPYMYNLLAQVPTTWTTATDTQQPGLPHRYSTTWTTAQVLNSLDYRIGCRNVSHCQQQKSYSGLRSPGQSNSTCFSFCFYQIKMMMTV